MLGNSFLKVLITQFFAHDLITRTPGNSAFYKKNIGGITFDFHFFEKRKIEKGLLEISK